MSNINTTVRVHYVDTVDSSGIDIEASSISPACFIDQVVDGGDVENYKYASLDGSWVLDDSYYLPPDKKLQGHIGWWGNILSDEDTGEFTPPEILILKLKGQNLNFVSVLADNRRMEYPVDFSYKIYYDNSLVKTINVTDNESVDFNENIDTVIKYDKIVLEIYKWSHPGRQAKILEMLNYPITSLYDDILLNVNLLEESGYINKVHPIGTATSNELSLSFFNKDRKFDIGNTDSVFKDFMKENRLVELLMEDESGNHRLGLFWTGDWDVSERAVNANVVCYDIIKRMDDDIYKDNVVLNNTNAKEMAENILSSFGLSSDRYVVDVSLAEFVIPYGYIDIMSYRQALEYVLDFCGGNAYVDRDGKVIVKSIKNWVTSPNSKETIGGNKHFDKDINIKKDFINFLDFNLKAIKPKNNNEDILSLDVEVAGDALIFEEDIKYDFNPCIDGFATLENNTCGASIDDISYHSWGISVKVVSLSAGSFTLKVVGKPFVEVKTPSVIVKDNSATEYKKLKVSDNNLRQTRQSCINYATYFMQVFDEDSKYIDLTYFGNLNTNIEDCIEGYTWRNEETSKEKFRILKQELEYNGVLRVRIVGRSV